MKIHKDLIYSESSKYQIKSAIKYRNLPMLQIKLGKESPMVHVCFGCKKFWERKELGDKHVTVCEHKNEHLEFLKSLLPEDAIDPVVNNVASEELLEQNRKLKEKLKIMEIQLTEAHEKNRNSSSVSEEQLQEYNDKDVALFSIVEYLYKNDPVYLEELKEQIHENYPEVNPEYF